MSANKNIKWIKSANVYFIISIIYKISLDLLYIFGTAIQYFYLGRGLNFEKTKYLWGWIVYLFFLYLIEKINITKIRFMIKIIFMLLGVSNISVYGLRNYKTNYFLIVLLFWILIIGLCILLPTIKQYKSLNKKSKKVSLTFSTKDNLIIILGALIALYESAKFGLNVKNFADIYTVRNVFRSQSLSAIDSYLMSWNGTVILPWGFLVSFNDKKYIKCILVLLLAILMFQINGLKTWLIMYIIIITFAFLLRNKNNFDSSLNIVMLGISSVIILALIYFFFTGSYELVGLLDRTIILPGEINYFYLDFFSNNELLFLRESIFKIFSASPYKPWSAVQISQTYMSAAYYHNATNGLIGDIYGNFGLIGIIIYPLMILLAFVFLNSATESFDSSIASVVIFILMWMLINTSFFTWLMTGGFILYIVILWFYKKYKIKI